MDNRIDIPADSVAVGNPARVINKLNVQIKNIVENKFVFS